jgi:hypothetical protein
MPDIQNARVAELRACFARGAIARREFLTGVVALGVSASAARAMVNDVESTEEGSQPDIKTFRITGYRIDLGDKMVSLRGDGVTPIATIQCTGENEKYLTLLFLSSDRTGDSNDSRKHMNTAEITASKVVARMYIPAQQYTWYVDLLRNEDPVYATLYPRSPQMNRIWCGEQVGDGELRGLVG